MKLWLLRPINPYDGLWDPWFDKIFGFVVRAETEADARSLAAKQSSDEGEKAWIEAQFSTCTELRPDGEPEVIIWDMHSA